MVMCAAYGCNSKSGRDKVGLFGFPRDPNLRKEWCRRIQGGNRTKPYEPTEHSKLCSRHFSDDQFDSKSRHFLKSIGFVHKVQLRLKEDAVPSIFPDCSVSSIRQSAKNIRLKKSSITSCQDDSSVTTTTDLATGSNPSGSALMWLADISLANNSASVGSSTVETQTCELMGSSRIAIQCAPTMKETGTQTQSGQWGLIRVETGTQTSFSKWGLIRVETGTQTSAKQCGPIRMDIGTQI